MKVLTEFLQVSQKRIKLAKREEELKVVIKAALSRGERVRNHAKEAFLIDVNNRKIEAGPFIEAFDFARFAAVADVSVTKVDALIKLGALQEEDVARITAFSVSHKIGIRAL